MKIDFTFKISAAAVRRPDGGQSVAIFEDEREAFAAIVRGKPVEELMAAVAGRPQASGTAFFIVDDWQPRPLTMDGLVATVRPQDYALWADESLPSGCSIVIAPGIRLSPPDAILYAAADGTGDEMVHAMGVVFEMVGRGVHNFGDLPEGMPQRFLEARADIEAEVMRIGMAPSIGDFPGATATACSL